MLRPSSIFIFTSLAHKLPIIRGNKQNRRDHLYKTLTFKCLLVLRFQLTYFEQQRSILRSFFVDTVYADYGTW